ncbi:MAG: two pore domain potassium channel family protein [Acidobacteriota bacterium]|nr:two pore domain potassium channel family protein [Acidobacteriota bacterium]
MQRAAIAAGVLCCLAVALDAFQTIILPRRPSGRLRITRLFYLITWHPLRAVASRVRNRRVREQLYSIYGPSSLILLLALWALLLVVGFALLYFALGSPFQDAMARQRDLPWGRMGTDLYVSGTTLFTLGLGDVLPLDPAVRLLIIVESGVGLGFVALVISYLPVLYQSFSRREVSIALLDARAGSPPTAAELLRRHGFEGGEVAMSELLAEWERWSAEILESHISYPLLCYYRSQHDNQSWLSALVAVLDSCALLITLTEGDATRQAQLTFAMARHALIDLGHVFSLEQRTRELAERCPDRLPAEGFGRLCEALGETSLRVCGDPASMQRLRAMRALYEPQAMALAEYLRMPLPGWVPDPNAKDQWRNIERLRREAAAVLEGTLPLSHHATAAHLHDEPHH